MNTLDPTNADHGFVSDASIRVTFVDDIKMVSVFDVIRHVIGSGGNQRQYWSTIVGRYPGFRDWVRFHKFPGAGQRNTPIVDNNRVTMLLNVIPGKKAAKMRFSVGDTPPQKRVRFDTAGGDVASTSGNGSDECVPVPPTPCAPAHVGYRPVIEPTQFFDRWKTRKALSAEHVAGVLDRFRVRNLPHLDLHPVYLGYCAAYCDWPDVVTTAQLHRHVVVEFRDMPTTAFDRHPLAAFFEPAADGSLGYVPKYYTVNEQPISLFEIDHILPRSWDLCVYSGPLSDIKKCRIYTQSTAVRTIRATMPSCTPV
jgi:hypothetical protein